MVSLAHLAVNFVTKWSLTLHRTSNLANINIQRLTSCSWRVYRPNSDTPLSVNLVISIIANLMQTVPASERILKIIQYLLAMTKNGVFFEALLLLQPKLHLIRFVVGSFYKIQRDDSLIRYFTKFAGWFATTCCAASPQEIGVRGCLHVKLKHACQNCLKLLWQFLTVWGSFGQSYATRMWVSGTGLHQCV